MTTLMQQAPSLVATTGHGKPLDLSAFRGRKVLLKFHRFSGCPVARRKVDEFTAHGQKLRDAGIETIFVLHNRPEKLVRLFDDVAGVHVIADARKEHYRAYGVAFRWRDLFKLSSWKATFAAFLHGYFPFFNRFEGGIVGVPSDFLVNEKGMIVDMHHGEHFGDSWTVSEVLQRAARGAGVTDAALAPGLATSN